MSAPYECVRCTRYTDEPGLCDECLRELGPEEDRIQTRGNTQTIVAAQFRPHVWTTDAEREALDQMRELGWSLRKRAMRSGLSSRSVERYEKRRLESGTAQ